jgi:hypothetical protein
MKLIKIETTDGGVRVKSPILRAMFFIFLGLSLALLSFNKSNVATLNQLTILVISVLAGGFITYGVLVFAKDIRNSKTFKELFNRMKSNTTDDSR